MFFSKEKRIMWYLNFIEKQKCRVYCDKPIVYGYEYTETAKLIDYIIHIHITLTSRTFHDNREYGNLYNNCLMQLMMMD